MNLLDWPACVLDRRTEVLGGELVLFVLHALAAGFAEKEADHGIGEHAIDEARDDAAQHGFTPELVE